MGSDAEGSTRECAKPDCDNTFESKEGWRRIYCEACSPPVRNTRKAAGAIEAALTKELVSAGVLGSVESQIALMMARTLDAGQGTPSSLATATVKFMSLRNAALESGGTSAKSTDPLDDLLNRRSRKDRTA